MAHVRTQIRDRVAATLLGTATAGSRVYTSRVDNMTEATIPGICVSTGAEVIDLEDSTLTATAKVVDLVIDAFALGENYDDVADQIQAEVEAKLYADNASGRSVRVCGLDSPLPRGSVSPTIRPI